MANDLKIGNRVIGTKDVNWNILEILQPDGFKEIDLKQHENLKTSIIVNNFVMSFYLWQDNKSNKIYVLDGVHRIKALRSLQADGCEIPKYLKGTFIECKNIDEAKKLILIFSSVYAKITKNGMLDFLAAEKLEISELNYLSLPALDIDSMMEDFKEEANILDDIKEDNIDIDLKEAVKKEYKCKNCEFSWR